MSTALVLGGGGITGIAWELGILAGLAQGGPDHVGIDLSGADLVIGTSAGSVVGAQITSGAAIEELYDRQLAPPSGELAAAMGRDVMVKYVASALWPGSDQRSRAILGRLALRAHTVPEAERRTAIQARVPRDQWPDRQLLITAVRARDGTFAVFDKTSGVSLVQAVGASCAVPIVWPPVTIGGERYIDGGARSVANADLAVGCSTVVVLAPSTLALRRSARLPRQLAQLGADVRTLVLEPDESARAGMGQNSLDPALRADAARAGRAQARTLHAAVAAATGA